ncbi:MAG TPA: NUDIX hydrolase [Mycobacteriales bacterium]|nr:NUDIX hydrolase [Mycobacteriales bacterium]
MNWLHCSGPRARHWGRHGAAGLLLAAPVGGAWQVLLDERADWVHHGGTVGVPGGAMHLGERPIEAALREVREEVLGLDGVEIDVIGEHEQVCPDCARWVYTTIVARTVRPHRVQPRSYESAGVTWMAAEEVETLSLHPGFAAAWPSLRALLRTPG